MTTLIYSMSVSLDGYIAGPDGAIDWSAPDEELLRFKTDQTRELTGHLSGRGLYEDMLVWETAEQTFTDPLALEFAPVCTAIPQVVFSTSPATAASASAAPGSPPPWPRKTSSMSTGCSYALSCWAAAPRTSRRCRRDSTSNSSRRRPSRRSYTSGTGGGDAQTFRRQGCHRNAQGRRRRQAGERELTANSGRSGRDLPGPSRRGGAGDLDKGSGISRRITGGGYAQARVLRDDLVHPGADRVQRELLVAVVVARVLVDRRAGRTRVAVDVHAVIRGHGLDEVRAAARGGRDEGELRLVPPLQVYCWNCAADTV